MEMVKMSKTTFCRTSTDDTTGVISCYVGDGEFTNDKLDTFGRLRCNEDT